MKETYEAGGRGALSSFLVRAARDQTGQPHARLYDRTAAAFKPLFVGGAWRSGTTLLHALVCTSMRVNNYIEEASHFSSLVYALQEGLVNFDTHTKYYFNSQDHYKHQYVSILEYELSRIWNYLNNPLILALKDPYLTRYFPLLANVMPEARFLVVIRDPIDTLASCLAVIRRKETGHRIKKSEVKSLCHEWNGLYQPIIDQIDTFGGRICLLPYEDIARGNLGRLTNFDLADIDPGKLWESSLTDAHENPDSPWLTPLYGTKLSDSSIGRGQEELSKGLQLIIMEICSPVWERFHDLITLNPLSNPATRLLDRIRPLGSGSDGEVLRPAEDEQDAVSHQSI